MSQATSLYDNNTIRTKALGGALGIHALLLLLFFFLKYQSPTIAPVEELGMEVNLGTDENGSGDDQPMNANAPAAIAAMSEPTASAAASDEKELLESDEPDAPVVNRTTTATKPATVRNNATRTNTNQQNNTSTHNTSTPQPARQTARYVYTGANGNGGNSASDNRSGTSEGNTTGNGDRGVPGGTPGSSNYTGSPGLGTGGIGHTLSGREISPKRFTAEFNESGKVVIRIKVDREGRILSKEVKSSPSRALSKIALQKLGESKFSPSPNAAPEQFGEVTILFKSGS